MFPVCYARVKSSQSTSRLPLIREKSLAYKETPHKGIVHGPLPNHDAGATLAAKFDLTLVTGTHGSNHMDISGDSFY